VDQPTGAGKTREIIAALDVYFYDRRVKVPIFPKATVCRNFYEELLRWPSRYRDFYSFLRPNEAARCAGLDEDGDWRICRESRWPLPFTDKEMRALCCDIREVLEMKSVIRHGRFCRGTRTALRAQYPDIPLPRAPLRALSYASGGGSFTWLGEDGKPMSAIMKFGYKGDGLVYSNKVVVLDEAHNLVRAKTQFKKQLQELRRQLFEAQDSVVLGFTGTLIPDVVDSGRCLLDTIKGKSAASLGDEGFLASLSVKQPPLFPTVWPRGVPDGELSPELLASLCRKVQLTGEAVKAYHLKLAEGCSSTKLQKYCNMASFCTSFHGIHREEMLSRPGDWMPKLAAIASMVGERREKAVIMISRQGGYVAMVALMKHVGAQAEPPFGVATGDQCSEFNAATNSRGESLLVLVADSGKFSEGTSFYAARRLYLAEIPGTACEFQQRCGRVARMFGHHDLPPEERAVTIVMPVAVIPDWLSDPLTAWCFRACCSHSSKAEDIAKSAQSLRKQLTDVGIQTLNCLKKQMDEVSAQEISHQAIFRLFRRWSVFKALGFDSQKLSSDKRDRMLAFGEGVIPPILRQLSDMLRALHVSSSDVVAAGLGTRTEDEEAVDGLVTKLSEQVPALAHLRTQTFDCDLGKPSKIVAVGRPDETESSEMEVSTMFFPSAGLGNSVFADTFEKEEKAAPKLSDNADSEEEGLLDFSSPLKRREPILHFGGGFLKRGRTNFPELLQRKEIQQAATEHSTDEATGIKDSNVDAQKAEKAAPKSKGGGKKGRPKKSEKDPPEESETATSSATKQKKLPAKTKQKQEATPIGADMDADTDKAEEVWHRFTPEINRQRCMARTWNGGKGGQCSKISAGTSDTCIVHSQNCSHGRVDGPIPSEKLRDFLAASINSKPSDNSVLKSKQPASADGSADKDGISEEHGAGLQLPQETATKKPRKAGVGQKQPLLAASDGKEAQKKTGVRGPANGGGSKRKADVLQEGSKQEVAIPVTRKRAAAQISIASEVGSDQAEHGSDDGDKALWNRFTPDVIQQRCMARTWNGGKGGQCAQPRCNNSDTCLTHSQSCPHGRVDGPIPAGKLKEFLCANGDAATAKHVANAGAPKAAILEVATPQ
jgi:hypothetical protein